MENQELFEFLSYLSDRDNQVDKELKPYYEAILQMELLGHQFYLYKDAETNQPTVVYKRKDGNYGVIEAE